MKKKTLQISPPLATPSKGDDMQGFLLFRSNTWNFRRKIPTELRSYFGGAKEIWRSLKTSARAEALKPCRVRATKTDRVFQFIRSSSPEEMKLAYIQLCLRLCNWSLSIILVLLCGKATTPKWLLSSMLPSTDSIALFNGNI